MMGYICEHHCSVETQQSIGSNWEHLLDFQGFVSVQDSFGSGSILMASATHNCFPQAVEDMCSSVPQKQIHLTALQLFAILCNCIHPSSRFVSRTWAPWCASRSPVKTSSVKVVEIKTKKSFGGFDKNGVYLSCVWCEGDLACRHPIHWDTCSAGEDNCRLAWRWDLWAS